jgi:hypothetical protein
MPMRSKRSITPCWTSRWLILIASLTLGGGFATTLSAQTPLVPSVEAGKPFKVVFDHDGQRVTHFRVLLNDQIVSEVSAGALVNGSVTVDMAPLTPGAYKIIAIARNAPETPFTNPSEAASPAYSFEARVQAPMPNPPMWRKTTILIAGQPEVLESIVPITELPEVLRLLADGTARVERGVIAESLNR